MVWARVEAQALNVVVSWWALAYRESPDHDQASLAGLPACRPTRRPPAQAHSSAYAAPLVGHRDLEETTIYLHLSQRHLSATASPLDMLSLMAQGEPIRIV
jgi:hypothetical protein